MSAGIETRLKENSIHFESNAPVSTTLLKAVAELIIVPECIEQIPLLLSILREFGRNYHIHGCGSKSLMMGTADNPLKTAIIKTNQLNLVQVDHPRAIIKAQAGLSIAMLSRVSAANGFTGLEFAMDIPGSTAGAIATDAWHPVHAYADLFEKENLKFDNLAKYIRDILIGVTLVDTTGNQIQLSAAELEMRDRKSILLKPDNPWFLSNAIFQLSEEDPNSIKKARKIISKGRKRMRARNKAKNPFSVRKTLGYTFVSKHPIHRDSSAIELIGSAGSLPSTIEIEGMMHSQETPNIIANTGSGTPDGYKRIADRIKEAVLADHGIELPLEVLIVN